MKRCIFEKQAGEVLSFDSRRLGDPLRGRNEPPIYEVYVKRRVLVGVEAYVKSLLLFTKDF
jgi:hypothetical protein